MTKINNPTISLETQRKNLLFSIHRSIRYNTKRQRFFECWDRFSNFISVVFGSSSVYAITQQNEHIAIILAVLLSVISAAALVIGFGHKARDHMDFIRQYLSLEHSLLTSELAQAKINEIKHELNRISYSEPPVLVVLEQICYNEQLNAEGFPKEKQSKINVIQRLFANYIDICPHHLMKK